jgi:A/G-specific adenine glycosylase
MELGATVCLPKAPLCSRCPLHSRCGGRAAGTVSNLPVKLRKTEPVHIEGALLVIRRHGRVLLRRERDDARRMAGFWRLPAPEDLPAARLGEPIGEFRHTITRHHYAFSVYAAALANSPALPDFRWFLPAQLAAIPLSTTARKALTLAGVTFDPVRDRT